MLFGLCVAGFGLRGEGGMRTRRRPKRTGLCRGKHAERNEKRTEEPGKSELEDSTFFGSTVRFYILPSTFDLPAMP